MKVTVVSRSGRQVIKGMIELKDSATVSDLQDAIHARTKNAVLLGSVLPYLCHPKHRGNLLSSNPKKRLAAYCDGNANSLIVVFKDLGMQVSYSTLFFWEYFGPLIIYPIFDYFLVYKYFGYKGNCVVHPVQTYAMYYWCFHYFKRIMEKFFVHRFSHATSPLSDIFRNCA